MRANRSAVPNSSDPSNGRHNDHNRDLTSAKVAERIAERTTPADRERLALAPAAGPSVAAVRSRSDRLAR